ncbi:hypothetical protein [Vibrio coralliilyticus]|uniref:hypothetical protein n=1 Tax=Vibrio coralliilyticus TaxID=190893 RepID=UPI001E2D4F5D|nr:hypothetical protein [Vibrio coralliilyticus]MCC2521080.1 hypothetical protein [Vibrio coralliilyticus]
MTIYFSGKNLAFYDSKLKKSYQSNDTWPLDLVEVDADIHKSMLEGVSLGKILASDSGGNPILNEPSQEELALIEAQIEHSWVQSELDDVVQIQLMYHWTDDSRATLTEESWKTYARELRNYTTIDELGNVVVLGERRPQKPTN